MEKKSKQKLNVFYCSLMVLSVLLFICELVLYLLSLISLPVFIVLIALNSIMFTYSLICYFRNKKREVQKLNLKQSNKFTLTDEDLIMLYNRAGIPVIYDENGKIKDIFELLELEIEYDEKGNRKSTIYEKLQIIPRFRKDGKEIPTVMIIKNRINALVKPKNKTGALKLALTDEQKEEMLLRQMLEKKLQESQEAGDTKKVQVIKKVISQQKKKSEPKYKPDGFVVLGKQQKPVSSGKVSLSKGKIKPITMKDLANLSAQAKGRQVQREYKSDSSLAGKVPGSYIPVKDGDKANESAVVKDNTNNKSNKPKIERIVFERPKIFQPKPPVVNRVPDNKTFTNKFKNKIQ